MRNLWAAVAAALRRWLARDELRTRPSQLLPAGDAAAVETLMGQWRAMPPQSRVVLIDEEGVVQLSMVLTPVKTPEQVEGVRLALHEAFGVEGEARPRNRMGS